MVCDHLKKIGNDFTVAIAHANLISFRKFLDQSDSLKSFKNKRRTNEIKNNEISHILCPKSYFGTGTYISMFKKMDINESLAQRKKSCCSLYDPIDSWSNFHSVFIFSEGFSEWLLKLWWWRHYTYINIFFVLLSCKSQIWMTQFLRKGNSFKIQFLIGVRWDTNK